MVEDFPGTGHHCEGRSAIARGNRVPPRLPALALGGLRDEPSVAHMIGIDEPASEARIAADGETTQLLAVQRAVVPEHERGRVPEDVDTRRSRCLRVGCGDLVVLVRVRQLQSVPNSSSAWATVPPGPSIRPTSVAPNTDSGSSASAISFHSA